MQIKYAPQLDLGEYRVQVARPHVQSLMLPPPLGIFIPCLGYEHTPTNRQEFAEEGQ